MLWANRRRLAATGAALIGLAAAIGTARLGLRIDALTPAHGAASAYGGAVAMLLITAALLIPAGRRAVGLGLLAIFAVNQAVPAFKILPPDVGWHVYHLSLALWLAAVALVLRQTDSSTRAG